MVILLRCNFVVCWLMLQRLGLGHSLCKSEINKCKPATNSYSYRLHYACFNRLLRALQNFNYMLKSSRTACNPHSTVTMLHSYTTIPLPLVDTNDNLRQTSKLNAKNCNIKMELYNIPKIYITILRPLHINLLRNGEFWWSTAWFPHAIAYSN